jgi:type II secretory pathway pseudopilin PulG
MRPGSTGRFSVAARGYALIGALIFLVIASLAVTLAVGRAQIDAQREREAELIFIGSAYRHAIADYFLHPPLGQAPSFPPRLEDLVEDPRSLGKSRWLRKLYADPITGRNDWVLDRAGGRIIGLHSASTRAPLRHAGFDAIDAAFSDAKTYQDWKFSAPSIAYSGALPMASASPATTGTVPASAPSGPAPGGVTGGGTAPGRPVFVNPAKNCAVLYGVPPNDCARIPPPMGQSQASCQAIFQQLFAQCLASIGNGP